jgi:ribosomal protein S27E
VQREFEDDLKCGLLEYGFLRVRCESCHAEQLDATKNILFPHQRRSG